MAMAKRLTVAFPHIFLDMSLNGCKIGTFSSAEGTKCSYWPIRQTKNILDLLHSHRPTAVLDPHECVGELEVSCLSFRSLKIPSLLRKFFSENAQKNIAEFRTRKASHPSIAG